MNIIADDRKSNVITKGSSRRNFLSTTSLAVAAFVVAASDTYAATNNSTAQSTETNTSPSKMLWHPYMQVISSPHLEKDIVHSSTNKEITTEVLAALSDIRTIQNNFVKNQDLRTLSYLQSVWPTLQRHDVLDLKGKKPSLDSYTELCGHTVPALGAQYGLVISYHIRFNEQDDQTGRLPLLVNSLFQLNSIESYEASVSTGKTNFNVYKVERFPLGDLSNTNARYGGSAWSSLGRVGVCPNESNARATLMQAVKERLAEDPNEEIKEIANIYETSELIARLSSLSAALDDSVILSIASQQALLRIPQQEDITKTMQVEECKSVYQFESIDQSLNPFWKNLNASHWSEPYSFVSSMSTSLTLQERLMELRDSSMRQTVLIELLVEYYRLEDRERNPATIACNWIIGTAAKFIVDNSVTLGINLSKSYDPFQQALLYLPAIIENPAQRTLLLDGLIPLQKKFEESELAHLQETIPLGRSFPTKIALIAGATVALAAAGSTLKSRMRERSVLLELRFIFGSKEKAESIYKDLQIGTSRSTFHKERQSSATRQILDIANESCIDSHAPRIYAILDQLYRMKVFSNGQREEAARLLKKFTPLNSMNQVEAA